jgi:hypothetical protein
MTELPQALLQGGGIELMCELTHSNHEPLALNALWALKNLLFHANDAMKTQVMSVLGWDTLRLYVASTIMILDARQLQSHVVWDPRISTDSSRRSYLSPSTTLSLRTQAFELLQNVLADATTSELTRTLEASGETALLDLVQLAARKGDTTELRVPAMYVLSNLALGNEKVRTALVGRVEILEAVSEGLVSKRRTGISLQTPRHSFGSSVLNHPVRPAPARR